MLLNHYFSRQTRAMNKAILLTICMVEDIGSVVVRKVVFRVHRGRSVLNDTSYMPHTTRQPLDLPRPSHFAQSEPIFLRVPIGLTRKSVLLRTMVHADGQRALLSNACKHKVELQIFLFFRLA